MKIFLDMHEIRSFKIRYTLQSFCGLLKNAENTTAFFVADSFYTEERVLLTERFLNKNLKVTLVPSKINRILFNTFKEVPLANLLKGQIFLIEMKKEDFFSRETLKHFLFSNKFYLRVFIFQKKFYRKNRLIEVFEKISSNVQEMSFDREQVQLGEIF